MPSSEGQIVEGQYEVRSGSKLTLVSSFGNVEIFSAADEGNVNVQGPAFVSLTSPPASIFLTNKAALEGTVLVEAGTVGNITLTTGPAVGGSYFTMQPAQVGLTVGPDVVGASIAVTPVGITLKVGVVELSLSPTGIKMSVPPASFELTSTGIKESVPPCARELSLTGHKLTAAETELNLGLTGQKYSGPITSEKTEGVIQSKETLRTDSTDAVRSTKAAMLMNQ